MEKRIVQWCRLILIPGMFAFGFGCASKPTLAVQEAGYPKDKVDARGLFTENCATCHGKDGRAKTFHGWLVGAQNLTDAKWQANTTDAEIIHAIKTGPSVMPAFGKRLSPAEIDALATFVRTFKQAEQPQWNAKMQRIFFGVLYVLYRQRIIATEEYKIADWCWN